MIIDETTDAGSATDQQGRNEPLVVPDSCSSLRCVPPQQHCRECSHALFFGEVYARGRRWPFEFSPMFGVIFTRIGDGEPKALQPAEDHPVWGAWSAWHKARFEVANNEIRTASF